MTSEDEWLAREDAYEQKLRVQFDWLVTRMKAEGITSAKLSGVEVNFGRIPSDAVAAPELPKRVESDNERLEREQREADDLLYASSGG